MVKRVRRSHTRRAAVKHYRRAKGAGMGRFGGPLMKVGAGFVYTKFLSPIITTQLTPRLGFLGNYADEGSLYAAGWAISKFAPGNLKQIGTQYKDIALFLVGSQLANTGLSVSTPVSGGLF